MSKIAKHNANICWEYGGTVLPDEEGKCSLCGAELIGMAVVYYKLVSLDPNRFSELNQQEALDGYTKYLNDYTRSVVFNYGRQTQDLSEAKTFRQWLETEI